jgi:hypothetical protein
MRSVDFSLIEARFALLRAEPAAQGRGGIADIAVIARYHCYRKIGPKYGAAGACTIFFPKSHARPCAFWVGFRYFGSEVLF